MKTFLILFITFCAATCTAQYNVHDTTYLDIHMRPSTHSYYQYYDVKVPDDVTMAPEHLIKVTRYYKNGTKEMTGYLLASDTTKRVGLYTYFEEKGRPKSLYLYNYNRSIDYFINSCSYLQKIEPCVADVDLGISLFLDGKVKHSGFYLSNEATRGSYRKVCTWKRYNPYTKNIAALDDYQYGKPDGRHFRYHGNGKLWREEYYKDGKKTGVWKKYWYDGSLRKTRVKGNA